LSKFKKLKGEVATVVAQSASKSCNAEGLAWGSSDKKVNWSILISPYCGKITVARHVGIVMRQHGARKCLNLREECGLPAHMVPSGGGGLNAAADGSVPHRG
jgi:hypothetical protein